MGCCSAFAWLFANFSLPLFIKVVLLKKACLCQYLLDILRKETEILWFGSLPKHRLLKSCQPQKFIPVKILSEVYLLRTDFFFVSSLYFLFLTNSNQLFKTKFTIFFQYQCLWWPKNPGKDCLCNILPNIIYIYIFGKKELNLQIYTRTKNINKIKY